MRRIPFIIFICLFCVLHLRADTFADDEEGIWQYTEKRSSGAPELSGELYFKSLPIPENLMREGLELTTEIGTFSFSERKNGHKSGEFLYENDTAIKDAKDSSVEITEEDIARHSYEAGFYDRKQGTPDTWVYLKVDNNRAVSLWVDPEFFAEIILVEE